MGLEKDDSETLGLKKCTRADKVSGPALGRAATSFPLSLGLRPPSLGSIGASGRPHPGARPSVRPASKDERLLSAEPCRLSVCCTRGQGRSPGGEPCRASTDPITAGREFQVDEEEGALLG